MNHESIWRKLIIALLRIIIVYSIVCIAIIALSFRFLVPLLKNNLPELWASILAAILIILFVSPFLRAIMIKKNHSNEFLTLWRESKNNRAPLVAIQMARVMLAVSFVMFIIASLVKVSVGLVFGIALLLVILMVMSRMLKKHSIMIERTFFQNLRSREMQAEYLGKKKPAYAGRLLSKDMHIADYELSNESDWVGKTLGELCFGQKYGFKRIKVLEKNQIIGYNIILEHNI